MLETVINNYPAPFTGFSELVRIAGVSKQEQAIAVVMMAFSTDPVARWMYPDPHQYFNHFPKFIEAFAGKSFEYERAYYTEGFSGAALWLPPDIEPDDTALVKLIDETVSTEIKEDVFAVLDKMDEYHPKESHWYLPMIGVDSFRQGNGYGSALMRRALIPCDREGKIAYLESSNPRNIPLYKRHGFELIGEIQAGSSPPLFPMLRPPQ